MQEASESQIIQRIAKLAYYVLPFLFFATDASKDKHIIKAFPALTELKATLYYYWATVVDLIEACDSKKA